MDQSTFKDATKALVGSLRQKLFEAASIATAAQGCADTGDVDRAIKIAMDCEDLAHQAVKTLQCLLILRRLAPDGEQFSV